ncbi:MAG: glutaredoxin [Candidatus Latescibacteria bacterium]|nr:glutaredoxin [Candidatus Latescibacterota bacterium]
MGFLRGLFGRDKKSSSPDQASSASTSPGPGAVPDSSDLEIAVYGTKDATRCVNVRELLSRNGYPYRDVRVDDDLSTRAWLQRATGDDALPKVFVGARCYGGFEDIQAMISDGTFEQALHGDLAETGDEDLERLKEEMTVESIIELLKRGEVLTINEGSSEIDVWAEPFARPPRVFYEGIPQPIEEIDAVVARIVERVEAGEITVVWKEEE